MSEFVQPGRSRSFLFQMTLFSSAQKKEWRIAQWGYVEGPLAASFQKFDNWVKDDDYRPLNYLADHRKDLRQDLRRYYPDYQSALVFLFSYADEKIALESFYQNDPQWNGKKIASYTLGFEGEDYHHFLNRTLNEIGESLKNDYPDLQFALTLDVHPVLERDLAYRAGLGWFGKNSMLIHREEGSFVMIGSLLLNQKMPFENPKLEVDHCGNCTKCIDLCPTEAIDSEKRTIIAAKCISTFTIELFKTAEPIAGHLEKASGEIFGCDICQDVCPWNKKKLDLSTLKSLDKTPLSKKIVDFFLRTPTETLVRTLESMGVREFRRRFHGTSFERSGRSGLLKNLLLYRDKK